MRTFLMTIVLLIAACASVGKPEESIVPSLASIATPEHAEKAIYAAAELYEAAMTQINRAHADGRISTPKHEEYVAIARKVQTGLVAAWDGVALWQTTGMRLKFDQNYKSATDALENLANGR